MAESAELADKLQGSVCRWISVSVNFQVCDWGATDMHWLRCEHEAGVLYLFNLQVQEVWITLILEKTLHQFPKGLWSMWTWTDHSLYNTSEQNNNDQESQVIQSTRTVLLEQNLRNSSVHAFENSWTDHRDSTALGRAGGQGHNAGCPWAAGEEGRSAGPAWLKVDFHTGNSPPGTRKLCFREWNSTAKSTGVGAASSE